MKRETTLLGFGWFFFCYYWDSLYFCGVGLFFCGVGLFLEFVVSWLLIYL